MGNSANAVLTTKFKATGGMYSCNAGEAVIPEDAVTPLDEKFQAVGYINEDGLKRSNEKDQYEVVAAGGVKVKTVTKGFDVSYVLTLMQSDLPALVEVFGAHNVSMNPETGTIRIRHNAANMPVRSFVWELADGMNSVREVCARGQVTNVDDVTFGTGEETVYTITITALDDENGDKANTYENLGDGPEAVKGDAA